MDVSTFYALFSATCFVVIAVVGCIGTVRLLRAARHDAGAGAVARFWWGSVVVHAVIAVAPEIARTVAVLDRDWGDVQPDAAAENAYLERHSWDAYAAWHLGLTQGATDETKGRLLAAHDLLQHLDATSGTG